MRIGSSPHARGTLAKMRPFRSMSRFIPACAGNAPFGGSSTGEKAVHPRIRGERFDRENLKATSSGSSPHTRGTRRSATVGTAYGRFIPAYAGNANNTRGAAGQHAVHPRMRGERLRACGLWPSSIRFIPAYAGNACPEPVARPSLPVHPRIRGERITLMENPHASAGSSPHTRGTPGNGRRDGRQVRFIPAYAGNASASRWQQSCPTVHPRIRGERTGAARGNLIAGGSSPHTRGTHWCRMGWRSFRRFIPAYAGNALPISY